MSTLPRSLQIFLADGQPNGIQIVTIANWTGCALFAPRGKLLEAIERPEASGAGVFFLLCEIPEVGSPLPLHIGYSVDLKSSIQERALKSDVEFERVCIVKSGDLRFTESHTCYLGSRLYELAYASGRARLIGTKPKHQSPISDSEKANLEYFIKQIQIFLPVLSYGFLSEPFNLPDHMGKTIMTDVTSGGCIVPLRLRPSRKGLQANAVERHGEVMVLKGSLAEAVPDFAFSQYRGLRLRLIEEKTLLPTEDGVFLRFTRDTLFSSPSAAAAVVYGRNANGRTAWELANTNQTLKDFQSDAGLRLSLGG